MSLTKVNYIDKETVITAQNLNDIQDSILGLEQNELIVNNKLSSVNSKLTTLEEAVPVHVSSDAPENPKIGDLWFDTSEPMTLPSLMHTLELNIPTEGYVDNQVVVFIDGILEDDFVIADLRLSGLDADEIAQANEELGKVLKMEAINNGIEILVSEIPVIEIPMKLAVIHR